MPYVHQHKDMKKYLLASGCSHILYEAVCQTATTFLRFADRADRLDDSVIHNMFDLVGASVYSSDVHKSASLWKILKTKKTHRKRGGYLGKLPVYPVFPDKDAQDTRIVQYVSSFSPDSYFTIRACRLGFLWAVIYGRTVFMRFLLRKGLNPNRYKSLPLRIAIVTGNIPMVQLLMENSNLVYQKIKTKYSTGKKPSIFDYIRDGNRKYVCDGANINKPRTRMFASTELCAKYDNLEILLLLVRKNPQLLEESIVHTVTKAIKHNSPEVMGYLFESHGLLIAAHAEYFMTNLDLARYMKPKFIEALTDLGVNVGEYKRTAIINAFFCVNYDTIRFLLSDGDRNPTDDELLTTVSMLSGEIDLINIVLEHKISTVTSLSEHRYLFHVNILFGNLEVLRLMLQCVHYTPEDLTEFLYTATICLRANLVKFLINIGAESTSIFALHDEKYDLGDSIVYIVDDDISSSFIETVGEFYAYDLDKRVNTLLSDFTYKHLDFVETDFIKNVMLYIYNGYNEFIGDSGNKKLKTEGIEKTIGAPFSTNCFVRSPLRLVM